MKTTSNLVLLMHRTLRRSWCKTGSPAQCSANNEYPSIVNISFEMNKYSARNKDTPMNLVHMGSRLFCLSPACLALSDAKWLALGTVL